MCRVASMDPVMHLSCPVTAVLDTLQHLKHTGGHLGREVGQFWSPVHTGLMGRSCKQHGWYLEPNMLVPAAPVRYFPGSMCKCLIASVHHIQEFGISGVYMPRAGELGAPCRMHGPGPCSRAMYAVSQRKLGCSAH